MSHNTYFTTLYQYLPLLNYQSNRQTPLFSFFKDFYHFFLFFKFPAFFYKNRKKYTKYNQLSPTLRKPTFQLLFIHEQNPNTKENYADPKKPYFILNTPYPQALCLHIRSDVDHVPQYT